MDYVLHASMALIKRADENDGCTKATCPASDSIYGYAPNLGANIFFVVYFAISSAIFFYQGFRWRGWWGFTAATTLGTALESVGYIARILLSENPFSDVGFKLNIVLLTFAPAFFTAGIYLLLKQFCLTFGPQYSRLKPKLYTYIFISCDVLSIILQGAGGALSAAADDGDSLLKSGEDLLIAGLSFQVVTLVIFAVLAADVFYSMWKHRHELPAKTAPLRASRKFRLFIGATIVSYLCILIRCSYRIAELQGGWGNSIMRNETDFIVLESVMIAIAVLLFNIFHPGYCFKRPAGSEVSEKRHSDAESDVGMVAVTGPEHENK
ncbi:hypothetical protein AAFC00_002617 [Neodothiora populina]|uniref:Sphingoid long-chain base transporter RSB1 n=1 Tax=Neodothiora populina TaxID=2781224 RepID=A0ABR3P7M6_9PEZI